MNIKNILDSNNTLDENTKEILVQAFDEAVELKANELVAEAIEVEKSRLSEEFMKATNEYETKLMNKVDLFLSENMDKFAEVVSEKLDAHIDNKKAELTMSIFDNIVENTAVNLLNLPQQINNDNELNALKDRYDEVHNKLDESKEVILKLRKQIILKEATGDLNLVDQEKISLLAKHYLDDNSLNEEDFEVKLSQIKEAFIQNDEPKNEPDVHGAKINETVVKNQPAQNGGSIWDNY